jgi:hypothetical protein
MSKWKNRCCFGTVIRDGIRRGTIRWNAPAGRVGTCVFLYEDDIPEQIGNGLIVGHLWNDAKFDPHQQPQDPGGVVTSLIETVAKILRADTAPGVPDVFKRVVRVEMDRCSRVISAAVVMFDGLPGRVRFGQFDMAGHPTWWSSWESTGGGAVSFENGKWVRLDDDGQPMPPLLKERA